MFYAGIYCIFQYWVAHKLGYIKQLNMTFSESGYYDFTIAQQIANVYRIIIGTL